MDPISFIATMAIEAVVNFGISYLFPSQGPRMKDLSISASTYGIAIPQIFGTARAGGCMIWAAPIQENKAKKTAGKGSTYIQYTYSCSMAFGFAKGPIQAFIKIWANGKLLYDATGGSPVVSAGHYQWRFYLGDETQTADPTISAMEGVNRTPGFRNLAYIVFPNFDLSQDFGNVIPQFAAQVVADATATVPSVQFDPNAMTTTVAIETGIEGLGGTVMPDYARGYYYETGFDSSTGKPVGLRFDMNTGKLLMVIPLPIPVGNGGPIAGVDHAGYLYISGAGNNPGLYKMDPHSFDIVASFWSPGSTPTQGLSEGPAWAPMIFSNDGTTALFFDLWGNVDFFDIEGLKLGYTGEFYQYPGFPPFYGPACPMLENDFAYADHLASPQTIQNIGGIFYTADVGDNIVWVVWDSGTPGVIFGYMNGSEQWVGKYSTDTNSVAWKTKIPASSGVFGGLPTLAGMSRITTNQLSLAYPSSGVGGGGVSYILDTVTGAFIDRSSNQYAAAFTQDVPKSQYQPGADFGHSWPIPAGAFFGVNQLYDSNRQAIFGSGNGPIGANAIVYAGLQNGASTTLQAIVENLFLQGGLTGTDYDMSPLGDTVVPGYGFANNADIKAILTELRMVYLFDIFESDNILKARMRGGADPDLTIDARCLGSSSPEVNDSWKQTRIQEADLPARITLGYMDINNDYQASAASYKRPADPIPTMYSKQQAAVQANICLDATTAKNLVRAMLFAQWQERTKHDTRLPWAYCYLDPSDLLSVNFPDGRNYFERINQTEMGADMTITLESFSQDPGAYLVNPAIVGDGGGSGITQTVAEPAVADVAVMNTPLLRDSDDSGGNVSRYYIGALMDGGPSQHFAGASVEESTDDENWNVLFGAPNDMEWGTVIGVVPDAAQGSGSLDWKTAITIRPGSQTFSLTSITDADLWNGANPIVIGQEVMQFRDAVQNADGTWTITNLLRGRRGTWYACATHGGSERMYGLDANTVGIANEATSAGGQERFYRAVGGGTQASDADVFETVYYPRDLMPYAVADIRRSPVPTGSADLTITWQRCTRTGGNWQNGPGSGTVPLNETSEAYELYILNAPYAGDASTPVLPPDSQIVRAVLGLTSPTYVYTAADQAADSFSQNLDILHVVIYQLSGVVGRGFASPRDIEPFRNF